MALSPTAAAALEQHLAKVRANVERSGSATISCEEIEALCPGELSLTDQFLCIAELARAEGWEIDFRRDRVVRVFSAVALRRATTY